MVAQNKDGSTQTFVGCYRMHLGSPATQGVPPFDPLAIEGADVKQAANNADAIALMAGACGPDGQPLAPTPVPDPADISAGRYLDNRTEAPAVMRSLFNAIDRHEYVRAYSYWEPGSAQRQPFDKFRAGYANTASVDVVAGTVQPDAGAGNIYYQLPAVLIAKNADGSKQTFAGCYTLHMVNPGMATEPPFAPLGVRSATVRQVPNDTGTQPLLKQPAAQARRRTSGAKALESELALTASARVSPPVLPQKWERWWRTQTR